MKQSDLESLLGRPLSLLETTNLKLYLDIAFERLEGLICSSLSCDGADREFVSRPGYSTVFIDITGTVEEVYIDEVLVPESEYTVTQNDNRNAYWFNSIVFKQPFEDSQVIRVVADWGLSGKPSDLKLLIARLFSVLGSENKGDSRVKSKKVEDFSVTYSDLNQVDTFLSDNQSLISKYSACGAGLIEHGHTDRYYYYDSI